MASEDILIGYGKIYRAPVAEANPDETSVAWGAAWGGNWTYLGDTLEPATMGAEFEIVDVNIEQSNAPVKQSRVNEIIRISTSVAEHTATLMQLLLGGTVTTTAAGASQKGFDSLPFGGETNVPIYKWGLEALRVDSTGVSQPVRWFFHKGSVGLNGDIPYDKRNAAGVPIQITMLSDTSQAVGAQLGELQIVTAAATS